MKTKLVVMLAATLLCACAGQGVKPGPVIDASSEAVFDASLRGMYDGLDRVQRSRLAVAVYILGLRRLRTTGELDEQGRPMVKVKHYDIADRIRGKRFEEIVRMAES